MKRHYYIAMVACAITNACDRRCFVVVISVRSGQCKRRAIHLACCRFRRIPSETLTHARARQHAAITVAEKIDNVVRV